MQCNLIHLNVNKRWAFSHWLSKRIYQ